MTGGENVAPLEVEQALLAHPAVADAGVAGLPDPLWGEAITAFVVLAAPVEEGELEAWCRERLAPFKVPKAIHALPELPRNAAGKLLRDRLMGTSSQRSARKCGPRTRHAASSVAQVALLPGLPASLPGGPWVSPFRGNVVNRPTRVSRP